MNENLLKHPLPGLRLDDYRQPIKLDDPVQVTDGSLLSESGYLNAVNELFDVFCAEGIINESQIPEQAAERRRLLRAIQNVRQPGPLSAKAMQSFRIMLEYEKRQKGVVDAHLLPALKEEGYTSENLPLSSLVLWRGDITRLSTDAIVNAANSQMLGCFKPLHACIDNAIHTAAGPELREDCEIIMQIQGHAEMTGDAKITRGYHLPARYVLHTVGPIVPSGSGLHSSQEKELSSCYESCLTLAAQVQGIRSVAFCAVSTGVFGYPKHEAALKAVRTVSEWMQANPGRIERVIFNVFSQEDEKVYQDVLKNGAQAQTQ